MTKREAMRAVGRTLVVIWLVLGVSQTSFAQITSPPMKIYHDGVPLPVRFGLNLLNMDCVDNLPKSTTDCSVHVASAFSFSDSGVLFNRPTKVVYVSGYVYVFDSRNYAVRKVNVSDGTTTLFTGRPGVQTFADGPVGSAGFFDINRGSVTSDQYGNMYTSDGFAIRKITPDGTVSTVVNPGSAHGGYLDGDFNTAKTGIICSSVYYNNKIYFNDCGNHAVRYVDLNTLNVTTLAGDTTPGYKNGTGTAAEFNNPLGIASDGKGNLYVGDDNNFVIRKIVIATGVVSTIAGSPGVAGQADSTDGTGATATFVDDQSDLIYADGYLYQAELNEQTIRKIDPTTGNTVTIAFSLGGPWGMSYDAADKRIFFGGFYDSTVKYLDLSNNQVTIVAGTQNSAGYQNSSLTISTNTTVAYDSIGTAQDAGLVVENRALATGSQDQDSPALNLTGQFWNGTASQPNTWLFQVQNNAGATGNNKLVLQQINNGVPSGSGLVLDYASVSPLQSTQDLGKVSTPWDGLWLGASTTLPVADSTCRGKLYTLRGDSTHSDITYQCLKSSTNTYSWVQVATGG